MSSFANLLNSLGGSRLPSEATQRSGIGSDPSGLTACQPSASRPQIISNPSLKRKLDTASANNVSFSPQTGPTAGPPMSKKKEAGKAQRSIAMATPTSKGTPAFGPKRAIALQSQGPPARGSYQELLARAEAAKKLASQTIGQIKHKPVVKHARLSKGAALRSKSTVEGSNKSGIRKDRQHSSSPQKAAGRERILGKPKRKPLELDYKGTMRPKTTGPSYSDIEEPLASARNARRIDSSGPGKSSTYLAARRPQAHVYDSGSEGMLDDDLSDSDSDQLDGGGFDELMAEEEASLRAAQKEDEAAMRQEEERKRRKAERKAALENLVASRTSKGA